MVGDDIRELLYLPTKPMPTDAETSGSTCPDCGYEPAEGATFCPDCGVRLGAPESAGASDPDELAGRTIFGEYEIVELLGEGGMGAVYLARQQAIDQKIAVKVLHGDEADSDETVQRFYREAKVISMLTHPNIVRVLVFGRSREGLLLLALEYVDGVELREKLDFGDLDELEAIQIMKQCCSAVAEAHDLGIIHRDLKPGNILLTEFRGEDNFVKILDFGIAKLELSHPDSEKLTAAGKVHGTPEFISPEQAQDKQLDGRSDIYALGCILYEMVSGHLPFEESPGARMLRQKVHEEPRPPSAYERVAPSMEELVMTAIARDRDDRFDDALEMYDALVARERELLSERDPDPEETYVPGSELTGMHRSVELSSLELPEVDVDDGGVRLDASTEDGDSATRSREDASEEVDAALAAGDDTDGALDDSPGRDEERVSASAKASAKRELQKDREGPDSAGEQESSFLTLVVVVGLLAMIVVSLAVLLGYLMAS